MLSAAARVRWFLSQARQERRPGVRATTAVAVDSTSWILLVGGITVVGLVLRLFSFDDSLYGDEVTTYGIVSGHGPGTVVDLVRGDLENTPPLFHLLAWPGERLIGPPEGVRLPSLISGVLAIPLTYLLGARTVGRAAGAVGAALIAVSPFLIFYSTEARSNALVMVLALASTLSLLAALQRGGWGWWLAYAALSAAAVYTQYSAAFLLSAQFAWAFVARPRARVPLIVANLGAALAFLPWLGAFLDDRHSPTWLYDTFRPLAFDTARHDTVVWLVGHPYIESSELIGPAGVALMLAGLALGAAGLVHRAIRHELPARPSAEVVLIALLAVSVPAGLVAYSLVSSTVYTPRNLIASSPAVAVGVGAIVTSGRRAVGAIAAALCIGGLGVGGARLLSPDSQRPDYAAAVDFIDAEGPPDSPVAEYLAPGWGPQSALEAALGPPHEYRPGGHPVFVMSPGGGQGAPPLVVRHAHLHAGATIVTYGETTRHQTRAEQARRAAELADGGRLFFVGPERLFVSYDFFPAKPPVELRRALPPGFRLQEVRTFPGFSNAKLSVYVYGRDASD